MSEYLMKVSGSKTLAQIENGIASEEALASRFLRSQLAAVDGEITNVVTFVELDELPADVRVVRGDAPPPDGFVRQWSGVMLVEDRNTVVTVYRKNG
ncbi:MAG: hypothetical protein GEV05_07615 [Betaproteobacteria bacterium]|nr:hypothetical protein [Betaproteobacteria bacterium]